MLSKIPQAVIEATPDTAAVWAGILQIADSDRLSSGDQLPSVRDLADRLHIKPTQVRDALLQAQARGVVRIVPRVGAFLQMTSPAARTLTHSLSASAEAMLANVLAQEADHLLQLLDARRLIEVELIGRAAERRRVDELAPARRALEMLMRLPLDAPRTDYVAFDIEFHAALVRLAGNTLLSALQNTLLELLRPFLLEVPPSTERRTLADRSHAAIYAAVAAGDAARAREEMRAHLSLAYDSLLRDLERPPPVVHGP